MHETVNEMLRVTPRGPMIDGDELADCIEACFDCAQTCEACADACLGEPNLEMLARCIRLNLDCADVCHTVGRMLSRQQHADFEVLRQAVELCEVACRTCADECDRHATHHEHCRICSETCRTCEEACRQLLADFDGAGVETRQ